MRLIEVHTHILPGIDDGAKNTDISIEMLLDEAAQGVELVIATPHYYGENRSVEDFLKRRNSAFESLNMAYEERKTELPELLLGAEVALSRGISARENLNKLCLGDTDAILIEMPFEPWGAWTYREVERIMSDWGLTIILAHPERYVGMPWDIKKLKPLFEMGVVLQINAEAVLKEKGRTKRFLKSECPCVLGSDAHNMQKRRSQIGAAARQLTKQYGENILEQMSEVYDILGF